MFSKPKMDSDVMATKAISGPQPSACTTRDCGKEHPPFSLRHPQAAPATGVGNEKV